jgi:UDPglucose 6-dehydrogenase
MLNVTVAGTGYVGLVTALCLASCGHRLTCLDKQKEKIERLKKGEAVIHEKDVPLLLHTHGKQMTFTTQSKKAFSEANVIIVAVGTPEKSDGSANLSYVHSVIKEIARHAPSQTLVLIKSTVPVGTGDQLAEWLRELAPDKTFHLVSNPEFLAQGTAVRDTLHPERIVIGLETEDPFVKETLATLYRTWSAPTVYTNRRSAELIKYASNNFLALKISYINEMANLCDIVGANIDDVAFGVGLDSRIGNKFLRAGTGYGGSCFPKDTKALHWLANFHDYEIKTVKAAIEVNENQKLKLIKKARRFYKSFKKLRVAVLGVTFKPATDDLRESPALPCLSLLVEEGAEVSVYDPCGLDNLKTQFGSSLQYCASAQRALKHADLCFIFTEWPEITGISLKKYAKWMARPLVLDGRNCYSLRDAEQHGVHYISIGRPPILDV